MAWNSLTLTLKLKIDMLCHLPGIVSSNPYVKVTISRLYISLTTFTVKLWNMLFISKCATFQFDAFILKLICHKVTYLNIIKLQTEQLVIYTIISQIII